ncbi:ATP-NAD kinase family protein [Hyperthermus butylicus]|uniref:Universally conserved protein n=1 Tax=Hyperthermus butylicus (strain DSM 5456 / JCM 9403 / PLM1-5) TaxID=415426 RepID=A2BM35_HYPBU|nr:ATP-NAD kinase family protein [Hyperthermus butylicus]ABM81046.1 universally conserved protein [Hyperthermus butylicus DSM 5456]
MARLVCFVVNPLAGIGGPLALRGSDGSAGLEALRRGARLVSPERARVFAEECKRLRLGERIVFLTASGVMGETPLSKAGFASYHVVYHPDSWPTNPHDTMETVRACIARGAEIVVFVGGDGTARDVVSALHEVGAANTPILGVPSGVKVYSSVFAENPRAAAHVLAEWLDHGTTCEGEVVDIDEDAFRANMLRARLYTIARTPCSPLMVGASKQPTPSTEEEEENKRAIARYLAENMEECTLYILGPGTTVKAIADELGVEKTLLGVDVVHNRRLVAADVDEKTLYNIVARHLEGGGRVKIVVTPIGGQGYIFGRGNQQISPRILRLVGRDNIIVVATKSKLSKLKRLRVDTGDEKVDEMLRGYIRVVTDYGEETVVRVE